MELTLEPGPKDVTISEPFVNRGLFEVIVITCNTSTEEFVVSTVDLNGDVRATIKASDLPAGVTQAAVCALGEAQNRAKYDNLIGDTYMPVWSSPTNHRCPNPATVVSTAARKARGSPGRTMT